MANPNPNTSGLTPFEKGQSGNPGGKTKAQREAEVQAAEDAAILRAKMTSKLLERVEAGEDVSQFIDAPILKLLKDSEDRGFGAPKQTVDNTCTDGSMSPRPEPSIDVQKLSTTALKEIVALQDELKSVSLGTPN